ncbi:hypothetical protein Tco_0893482 [Tanacetum coccineum]|uniref:BZIP domain-containing protein n=1 Tax=Tanacetum coccineum TaxID=301880 RepID=A0ABQ5C8Y7_9ASTR
MIKEHDQQVKTKTTPRKHVYADSEREAPDELMAKSFSDRLSFESSGTSDIRGKAHSADKSQKSLSKGKELSHLIRSRRLENQSKAKERARREKTRGRRPEYQEIIRTLTFMHGHGHLELAKKLNDKIPKTVDEMFERVRAFIRGEVVVGLAEMSRPPQWDKGNTRSVWSGGHDKARNRNGLREVRRNMGMYTPYSKRDTFTPLTKTLKEILAMESISFPEPPPLIGTPEKHNLSKICDY